MRQREPSGIERACCGFRPRRLSGGRAENHWNVGTKANNSSALVVCPLLYWEMKAGTFVSTSADEQPAAPRVVSAPDTPTQTKQYMTISSARADRASDALTGSNRLPITTRT